MLTHSIQTSETVTIEGNCCSKRNSTESGYSVSATGVFRFMLHDGTINPDVFLLVNKHISFTQTVSNQLHVLVQWAIIRLASMEDKNILCIYLPILPT